MNCPDATLFDCASWKFAKGMISAAGTVCDLRHRQTLNVCCGRVGCGKHLERLHKIGKALMYPLEFVSGIS